MSLTRQLRVALRSHSWRFGRHYVEMGGAKAIDTLTWWNGDSLPVYYRRGSSDLGLIYNILIKRGNKSEYWLPDCVPHTTILDIGANSGVTSRYLSCRFPEAIIHSFEPVPANVDLLRRNVDGKRNVIVHNYGLGAETAKIQLSNPGVDFENMGMFSKYAAKNNGPTVEVSIRSVKEVLEEEQLRSIDIIKIDTEGAEYDILSSFPQELLAEVKWIYGELHSSGLTCRRDFAVLDMLSKWFAIEVFKPLHRGNYSFDAVNLSIVDQFMNFRRNRKIGRY